MPLAAIAGLTLAGCGGGRTANAPPVTMTTNATLSTQTLNGNPGFVAPSGFTTYVFDADLAAGLGMSVCTSASGCTTNWPPVTPPAGVAGSFSALARTDGTQQLMYSQHPLYTFKGDSAAGMTNGDGINAFGGVWHIARPMGTIGNAPGY